MTPNDLLTKQDLDNFKKELFELLKPITDSQMVSKQKWLRSKDVREFLNISAGTLNHLRVTGALVARKIGKTYFYSAEDIDKELNKGEKKSPKRKS
ncbi:hypothetical protein GCM10023149_33570 [Mucilaginibacter gynuensis]|uniref:Helix-turn-helix domain-containing protein n=1 Tax=Mucilaginibacter gynuensis TaxID=1302236 RepID=A0ABP8GS22_9SPHI